MTDLDFSLAVVERHHILATLAHFDGHKTRAAAALGISLKTLYNRLHAYRKAGYTLPQASAWRAAP